MKIKFSILLIVFSFLGISAQNNFENINTLPIIEGNYLNGAENDWLIKKLSEKAKLFRNKKNNESVSWH